MSKLSRHDRDARARARKQRRYRTRLEASAGEGGLRFEAADPVQWSAAGDGADASGPKRFTMTLYRGGRMRPVGFYCDLVVDLAGVKIAPGKLPAYLDHDRARIVGHHERMTVSAAGIVSDGVISGASDAARQVRDSAALGFPWKASVGGTMPGEDLHFIERGESAECNGKTWKGPIYILRSTTIYEGSFVTIAGDSTSSAKIAARNAASTEGAEIMGFEAWLKAKGFDPTALSDAQKKSLEAMYKAELQAAAPEPQLAAAGAGAATTVAPPPPPQQLAAGGAGAPAFDREALIRELRASAVSEIRGDVSAEMQRHAKIRSFASKYEVSTIEADGAQVDFVAHAIDKGWSPDKAELEAMRAGRPTAGPAIHVRGGQVAADVLEASVALTANMDEQFVAGTVPEASRQQVMNQATSREYRGAKIHTVMHATIQAAGMYSRAGVVNNDFIRTALEADQKLRASGPSTTSLSGILGNVANKALQGQYRAVPNVVHEFCKKATAGDFKPQTRYRLTGDATFLEVGANGEIQSFELGEDVYTNALKTYGRQIMLNRQMMWNDDLGAFLQLPEILGRGAALCRNKGTFTLLLSNPSNFFHANNANYFEGAATNLSIASLTLGEQKFLELKDSKGNFIEGIPALLLCPPAIKVIGDQLYTDTHVNETTTANAGKPNSNPHAGKFKVISSPYLGTSGGISGASDTAWYLAALPSDVAFMEIAYLNGNESPVLESSVADFDVLGMKWRSYWDYGVAMANTTGAVKSKGAA